MKKLLFSFALVAALGSAAVAQDDKYTKAMEPKVMAFDTVRNPAELMSMSAAFERIGDAEKTKWQPYYYAALTQVRSAYFLGQNVPAAKTDPLADKAEMLINKADALSPDNSEIYVVKKMIANLRMMPATMERYQQYGPVGEQALQTAIKLNPENPRVYILQAQDKFFTPEQWGGSKTEAKKLFEKVNEKFAASKPANNLEPNWGRGDVAYFMSELNK